MIRFRPHRGMLEDSIKESQIFNSIEEMINSLQQKANRESAIAGIIHVDGNVYYDRIDNRIMPPWNKTYLVHVTVGGVDYVYGMYTICDDE